jgi:hypothetical protein
LKRVPLLEFFFDESVERGDRIERILNELSAERDEAPAAERGPDPAKPGPGTDPQPDE